MTNLQETITAFKPTTITKNAKDYTYANLSWGRLIEKIWGTKPDFEYRWGSGNAGARISSTNVSFDQREHVEEVGLARTVRALSEILQRNLKITFTTGEANQSKTIIQQPDYFKPHKYQVSVGSDPINPAQYLACIVYHARQNNIRRPNIFHTAAESSSGIGQGTIMIDKDFFTDFLNSQKSQDASAPKSPPAEPPSREEVLRLEAKQAQNTIMRNFRTQHQDLYNKLAHPTGAILDVKFLDRNLTDVQIAYGGKMAELDIDAIDDRISTILISDIPRTEQRGWQNIQRTLPLHLAISKTQDLESLNFHPDFDVHELQRTFGSRAPLKDTPLLWKDRDSYIRDLAKQKTLESSQPQDHLYDPNRFDRPPHPGLRTTAEFSGRW